MSRPPPLPHFSEKYFLSSCSPFPLYHKCFYSAFTKHYTKHRSHHKLCSHNSGTSSEMFYNHKNIVCVFTTLELLTDTGTQAFPLIWSTLSCRKVSTKRWLYGYNFLQSALPFSLQLCILEISWWRHDSLCSLFSLFSIFPYLYVLLNTETILVSATTKNSANAEFYTSETFRTSVTFLTWQRLKISLGVGWTLKCLRTRTAWSLAFSEQSRDRHRPSPTWDRSYGNRDRTCIQTSNSRVHN